MPMVRFLDWICGLDSISFFSAIIDQFAGDTYELSDVCREKAKTYEKDTLAKIRFSF